MSLQTYEQDLTLICQKINIFLLKESQLQPSFKKGWERSKLGRIFNLKVITPFFYNKY